MLHCDSDLLHTPKAPRDDSLTLDDPSDPTERERIMNDAINTKSEQVRELTEDEVAHVSGGIIAILIGMLTPSIPIPPPGPGFLAR